MTKKILSLLSTVGVSLLLTAPAFAQLSSQSANTVTESIENKMTETEGKTDATLLEASDTPQDSVEVDTTETPEADMQMEETATEATEVTEATSTASPVVLEK